MKYLNIDGLSRVSTNIKEKFQTKEDSTLSTTAKSVVGAINEVNELASTQPDWNENNETSSSYIKNRPFYETATYSDTLTWDGNTEGLLSLDYFGDGYVYKVSNSIPNISDFTNGFSYVRSDGFEDSGDAGAVNEYQQGFYGLCNGYVYIIDESAVGVDLGGVTFSETGIYFLVEIDGEALYYVTSLTINGYNGFETKTIKTIDIKYLPEQLQIYAGESTDLTSHISDTSVHMTSAEKTKLAGIADNATAVGKSTTGKTYTISGVSVTAGTGAEIFNNYTYNKASGDYSHAEGYSTTASGSTSHVEGNSTTASGQYSHAEGHNTTALGNRSHAEGWSSRKAPTDITSSTSNNTIITSWNTSKFSLAKGEASHVEGINNLALGNYSHAEGNNTIASGSTSHVEGNSTTASGQYSHAEGHNTTALGTGSHAEGYSGNKAPTDITSSTSNNTIITSWNTSKFSLAKGNYSHVEGMDNLALGNYSHAEGNNTIASGQYAHAEGSSTTASGSFSHAEGSGTTASGTNSHAEGISTTASQRSSHAEGEGTTASGEYGSHAEGYGTTASGMQSHAEGSNTTASGEYGSHAEGSGTTASGDYSHAEGGYTTASGIGSHAEGGRYRANGLAYYPDITYSSTDYSNISDTVSVSGSIATGHQSHAEGTQTLAYGYSSHSEGIHSAAFGDLSHVEGEGTRAASSHQHVQGKYNIVDTGNTYAHIVGNGESDDARSNAYTLDWDGNAWFAGDVYVGGTSQSEGSKLVEQSEVGLTAYSSDGLDPDTCLEHVFLTNSDTPNGGFMYFMQLFYGGKAATNNRMQIAFPYKTSGPAYYRYCVDQVWSGWHELIHNGRDGALYLDGTDASSTVNSTNQIVFRTIAGVEKQAIISGPSGLWFSPYSNEIIDAVGLDTSVKSWRPITNDNIYLGAASYKWKQVYAMTSEISTSDRNAKENINPLDERYEALFAKLQPVSYELKDTEASTHDRVHTGFISQDVEAALTECGMTSMDFAAFCKDEVVDEEGNTKELYSLRYDEFIALNTHMIQKQQSEIEALKAELAELKALLTK